MRQLLLPVLVSMVSISLYFESSTVRAQSANASALATSSSTGNDAPAIAEIVVTAQRRNERVQDVPIAIDVVSGAALNQTGVATTQDLGMVSPGFNPRESPGGFAPSIRGIGSLDGLINSENAVPIYVDGVYYASAPASALFLSDVERVEVLKGPQGTLFGRNAAGGLISVITRTPSQETQADGSFTYANYKTFEEKAYFSTGIAEHLAFGVSAAYRKQENGWGSDLATHMPLFFGSDLALRSKQLYTPTDSTSITLEEDYARRDYDNQSTLRVQSYGSNWFNNNTDTIPKSLTDYGGGSLTLNQELGFAKVVSISAYHEGGQDFTLDGDETPLPFVKVQAHGVDRNFTQELQLQSLPTSDLTWIVGGFYMSRTAGYEPLTLSGLLFPPPITSTNDPGVQHLHSYSGFGQATYPVLPGTNLTLGARYTSDHVTFTDPTYLTTSAGGIIPVSEGIGDRTFDKITYRISLDHRVDKHALLYVSYNTGFKGGQFNLGAPGGNVFFAKPQTVGAVEAGIKSDWLGGKLRLNLSAFHYDEKDVQVIFITTGIQQYVNAGTAKITGLDFEGIYAPVSGLELRTGLSYLPQASYGQFGPCPNPGGIANTALVNCNGQRVIQAPKIDLSESVNYHFELGSRGAIDFNAALQFTSAFPWDAFYRYYNGTAPSPVAVDATQPSYSLLNSSVTWREPSGHFSVSLWGKNLTDKQYAIFGQGTTGQNNKNFNPAYQNLPGAPRTYGVTMTGKY